jgi:hypothetical protein
MRGRKLREQIRYIFNLPTKDLCCLPNVWYMFRRSLRHPQGELFYHHFSKPSDYCNVVTVLELQSTIVETCSRYLLNNTNIQLYIFSHGATAPVWTKGLPYRASRSQSVGLLWTSDHPEAETSDNTQHTAFTDVHAPDGIRTGNPSKRAAAYPRLRPRCHCDRRVFI